MQMTTRSGFCFDLDFCASSRPGFVELLPCDVLRGNYYVTDAFTRQTRTSSSLLAKPLLSRFHRDAELIKQKKLNFSENQKNIQKCYDYAFTDSFD